ncbi:MAG TPA: DUF4386 domain-containing protein [Steroidobacteraceae bacterium]|jgi:hypothetical protein|nr:DUF4386 domain-containing protein [Steroidobacteraceae bacterium]
MSTTTFEHPRLMARIAGVFYLIVTACALFSYLYVRGQVINGDDMAQTAANLVAHEQLYRFGFAAALIVVICNLPMGFILCELLKVVNARLALLALLFITAAATLEAVNLFNYIEPLLAADGVQALARGTIRMWSYAFSVSLTFFGVYCALIGTLVFRSGFFPRILGVLLVVAGVTYWINAFRLFLALPIPYIEWVTFIGEQSMTLWLLVVGLDEAKWRERAAAYNPAG